MKVITIEQGEIARIYRKYRPRSSECPNATVFYNGGIPIILIDEAGDSSIDQAIGGRNAVRFLLLHEYVHLLQRALPHNLICDLSGNVDIAEADPESNNDFANGYAAERLVHELLDCNERQKALRVMEVSNHYGWKGPSSRDYQK